MTLCLCGLRLHDLDQKDARRWIQTSWRLGSCLVQMLQEKVQGLEETGLDFAGRALEVAIADGLENFP